MVRNRTTKKMLAENYDLVDAQVNELINSVNGLVEYHSVLNDTAQSKLRYELDKVLISVGKTNININSIEKQTAALIDYINTLEHTDVIENKSKEPNWEVLRKLFYSSDKELEAEKAKYYKERKR